MKNFLGLNYADVMNEVTAIVKPVIKSTEDKNKENTIKLYAEMKLMLSEVKDLIIEQKNVEFQYKNEWEIALNYVNKFLGDDFQSTLVKLLNK